MATRAGLGWIGKNCLLVTPQYGAAIRISSFLTNAPLECNDPINQSRCGYCNLCVKKCPAQALKGTLWEVGIQREEIVDINKCYKKQVEIMLQKTGIETDLCGRCFAVCVYTQKYLKSIAADFKDTMGRKAVEYILPGGSCTFILQRSKNFQSLLDIKNRMRYD